MLYLTVESHDDEETHALKSDPNNYVAECGAAPSFPVGKAEPTCPACRTALGLPVDQDPAVVAAFNRLGDSVKARLEREKGAQQ
ncbi:hypothetical protein [Streptomyces sp. NPDC046832]|uniref:hypothetical protein n=1 Tax=Streptomyces sp. NPDC046832 TaxID=3155020 RepID=UPI0033F00C56